jgi:CBS domain-containing protein
MFRTLARNLYNVPLQQTLYNSIPRNYRNLSSSTPIISAMNVFEKSCYHNVDFKINENATAKEGVIRFSVLNIGCLAVVNNNKKLVGVFSKRDYIDKVAVVNRDCMTVKIKDICTISPNILFAKKTDTLDDCMNKMMFKNIRHLLILDEKDDSFIGMISIRDLIKEVNKKNHDIITRLSDFNIGKGAYFGSE